MKALASIGPGAKDAVPALVRILNDPGWALDGNWPDYTIHALVKIGKGSRTELPALREVVESFRGIPMSFVESAIEEIEK